MAFIKITDRINNTTIILNDSCIVHVESDQRGHSNIVTSKGVINAYESVEKIDELINPAPLPDNIQKG